VNRLPDRIVLFIALGVVAFLSTGCREQLSDARVREIRQSPFLGLPPSATQVASIDVNKFRQFSMYERIRRAYVRSESRGRLWNELSRQYEGDPLSRIDRIVMGGYAPLFKSPMDQVVVIMTGSWGDDRQFLEAFRSVAAEGFIVDPTPFQEVEIGKVINAYTLSATSAMYPGEPLDLYMSFPGPGICVMSLHRERFERCNDIMFERHKGIMDDPGWSYHFGRIRLDHPVWVAGWTPFDWKDFISEKIRTVPELDGLWGLAHNHPTTFYAYLSAEPRYLLDIQSVCETAGFAEKFTFDLNRSRRVIPRMLLSWFPQGGAKTDVWQNLFDGVQVRADGASVEFKLEMQPDEVDRLVDITMAEVVATPTPRPIPEPFLRR
jgi:hypothetical protein